MQYQTLAVHDVLTIGTTRLEILAIDEASGEIRCGISDGQAELPYREVVLSLGDTDSSLAADPDAGDSGSADAYAAHPQNAAELTGGHRPRF